MRVVFSHILIIVFELNGFPSTLINISSGRSFCLLEDRKRLVRPIFGKQKSGRDRETFGDTTETVSRPRSCFYFPKIEHDHEKTLALGD